MNKFLSDYRPEEEGIVRAVRAEGAIRRRLYDMGLTPGARVRMRRAAPLGDPIEITVRGYELSLRRAEAATVETEVAL